VIFGLPVSAKGTIDIGRERSSAHIAGFDGVKNAANACALAAMLLIHRKYGIQRMNNLECKPTKTQIVQLAKNDPRIAIVAGHAAMWGKKMAAPRAMTFCYYLFAEQDHAKTEKFFAELLSGVGLTSTSPTYQLRERLIANRSAKAKLPLLEVIALFFKAWIAYRSGKQVRVLRWTTTGATPQAFPEI
jgi:hypothetical protein